jgi:hypothetical protein
MTAHRKPALQKAKSVPPVAENPARRAAVV